MLKEFYDAYHVFWEALNVSRETCERLSVFEKLFQDQQKSLNLISRHPTDEFWLRHIIDSAQLTKFVSRETISGIDFGSGGGFPGIILSILNPNISFTLVEAREKKANFLKAVVQELSLNAQVCQERIEDMTPWKEQFITARALAPLEKLLPLVFPFVAKDTLLALPKGKTFEEEISKIKSHWEASVEFQDSLTSAEGKIILLRDLKMKKHPLPKR